MSSRSFSIKVLVMALLVMLLAAVLIAPVGAKADTITYSISYPLDLSVFNECADGGNGEIVELSGNMHEVFHVTLDGKGGLHVKTHINPQGVSGVGLTTGAKYQGVGVTQDKLNAKTGETFTYVNNYRIIGQGPGNNFMLHENIHFTVNANGEVTASHENFSATCR